MQLPETLEFRKELKDQKGFYRPYDFAAAYALAGERDVAFHWLQKTYELPYYHPFATDARFDSLRDDPRFEKLLRKLNLPEEAIQRHLALR